mmetsp:Transcript_23297/g.41699  ORF Transcript_23297/g.41699 Transcript_23297/m.41699 type:complete len:367 (+) Transcript_23297:157-1257(+)|eukprot:CAMPEP_0201643476 /NCGR_PEP_ID=MMETSP0493-20130528/28295_1 /ASSEMBLY_ACC=CAM_ASM_000838 /TAXON_ID=420259 /ORGANISM="Thalassiosira gravida, Strain GMp14c1" /LENGTH=366 /DNA_ID=CAMNT_0048117913 /DNA_START=98 /DNA_END=1198 /DNA_ORIENTATION=-
MTAKHLQNKHGIDQDCENIPEMRDTITSVDENLVVSDDDDDDGSCSSSDGESSDDPSTTSPNEPSSTMNPDQIRENARAILHSSPDNHGSSSTEKNEKNKKKEPSAATSYPTVTDNVYASYQDTPTASAHHNINNISSTTEFSNYSKDVYNDNNSNTNTTTTTTPPWASHDDIRNSSHNNKNNDEGLTVTDVASLAFTCVAHCLTEGYRAASTYYGGASHDDAHDHHNSQTQYPSVSGLDYRQVDNGYYHNNVNNEAAYGNNVNVGSSNHNNDSSDNNGGGYKTKGYYSDSYQTEGGGDEATTNGYNREVMDRGSSPRDVASQMSGQDTEQRIAQQQQQQVIEQKDEWATVHVPSTYQGGRVGSGN